MLLKCGAQEDSRVPWTARRSNQSILKEINPEYSLEGLILKLKLQYYAHLMWRAASLAKTLMLGKIEVRWVRWHHWLNGHETEQSPDIVEDREAWCVVVHGVTEMDMTLQLTLKQYHREKSKKTNKSKMLSRQGDRLSVTNEEEAIEHLLWTTQSIRLRINVLKNSEQPGISYLPPPSPHYQIQYRWQCTCSDMLSKENPRTSRQTQDIIGRIWCLWLAEDKIITKELKTSLIPEYFNVRLLTKCGRRQSEVISNPLIV